jgi:hypothetical protein
VAYKSKTFDECMEIIRRLPESVWWDTALDGSLGIQADGDMVQSVRAALGGVWTKKKNDWCAWWEYHCDFGSVHVKIYGDRVGPKSCKRIEETRTERVHIPAVEDHYEEREVKSVRWECPEDHAETLVPGEE